MKYAKQILTLIALTMLAALVACSSGSSSNTNPPPPPTTTIAATSGSSQSAQTGAAFAAPLVATVTKGGSPVSGASVTFTAPSSGASGTFGNNTATETDTTDANGKATSTTFTANTTAGTYAVTATVSGASTPASFSLTNTGPVAAALADGTYVFQLSGTYGTGASSSGTAASSPYFVAGAFVVSGGIITGGEQDFVDANNNEHDAINNTNYKPVATPDGNVQVVLTTCTGTCPSAPDPNVGLAGVETLNIAMGSATSGRVVEFDTAATSSGTINLQDSTAAQTAPTGAYIFGVQGWNSGQGPLAITGILDVSGATLSTTGSVFDLESNYVPFSAQTISSGTVGTPNGSGRVVFGVTPTSSSFKLFNLVGYIVDATHIRLVEGSDQLGGTTGGTAYAQTGSLTVSGNSYVVAMTGSDQGNGTLQSAALLTLGSTGNVTGTISYSDLTVLQPAGAISAGTYLADTTYPGRVTLSTVTDGSKTFNLQLYVDGNGNALAMTLDTAQDVLQGVAYQQASSPTLSGTYAMDATGADKTNKYELDAVGSITTGSGTFASTTSTGVDLNWISGSTGTVAVPATNLQVSGAFSTPSGGVSSGAGNTVKGLDVTTAANSDAFTYYVVDSNRAIAIETDANQLSLIFFEK